MVVVVKGALEDKEKLSDEEYLAKYYFTKDGIVPMGEVISIIS